MTSTDPRAAPGILVTDGDTRPALALVRALGRRGLRVEVLSERPRSLAGSSRFCAGERRVPSADRSPEAWARAVQELLLDAPGRVLIPVTEVAMGTLYESGFDKDPRVVLPPEAAYRTAVDKARLLALAEEAGLQVPRSVEVQGLAALREALGGMALPLVVKARHSRFRRAGRWHAGPVHLLRSREDIERCTRDPALEAGALIQEFVAGHGEGLFLAARRGAVVARFAHRRLREKPPTGGVAVLAESISPEGFPLRAADSLLERLGWHGIAMLEFRRTPDGRAVLMEMNPRVWGSLQLAVDAGADFPGMLLDLHRDRPVAAMRPRVGVRTRWLLGDLDHLWLRWREPGLGPRGFGRALWEMLRSFQDARLEVLRWDDPAPFGRELRDWIGWGRRS